DGYGLRAADTLAAPATLKVIGEAAAGRAFAGAVGPGEAVRIFTGAPLPTGADAVVVQEDVRREGDRVTLAAPVPVGDNLRPEGLDFCDGEALILAGRRLSPRDVALAAAANHAELPVRRHARVAILATGDELVAPGGTLGPSQIVASNNFTVAGIVDACGGIPIDLGIARDSMEALDAAIREALDAKVDVLVTLGGASVGDHDLVQKALVAAGMELSFWKIAMRPGKPLMHGRLGELIVLGLPGNPTSSSDRRRPPRRGRAMRAGFSYWSSLECRRKDSVCRLARPLSLVSAEARPGATLRSLGSLPSADRFGFLDRPRARAVSQHR